MAYKYNASASKSIHRFTDISAEPQDILPPIKGFENMPIVSLEEAVQPLIKIVDEVEQMIWTVKQKCSKTPANNLSIDESASIMLYTLQWPPHRENSFYFILNRTLRTVDRGKLKPWFHYLKLVTLALSKLPSFNGNIYRGVKEDLHEQYSTGNTFVWWDFSSCTRSISVLQTEAFLGTKGKRTMFNIECSNGKDIRHHSCFPTEDEVLLLPARQFCVQGCLNTGDGLYMIQIREIQPPFSLLAPVHGLTTPTQMSQSSTIPKSVQVPISLSQPNRKEPLYSMKS
ncbi:unnamed protein product [Adineta steineri]|uniref:NAD(P)(+)--arginine ADP-ribosyltransferase n=1 Tax=Adineta steineri TaxID=433720 RepID=A0A814YC81_9BILA|nr:unnamed protein product [Adineta steineri]